MKPSCAETNCSKYATGTFRVRDRLTYDLKVLDLCDECFAKYYEEEQNRLLAQQKANDPY